MTTPQTTNSQGTINAAILAWDYLQERSRRRNPNAIKRLCTIRTKLGPDHLRAGAADLGRYAVTVITHLPGGILDIYGQEAIVPAILDTIDWAGGLIPQREPAETAQMVIKALGEITPEEEMAEQQRAEQRARIAELRKAQLEATQARLMEELAAQDIVRLNMDYDVTDSGRVTVKRVDPYTRTGTRWTLSEETDHAPYTIEVMLQEFAKHLIEHQFDCKPGEGAEGNIIMNTVTRSTTVVHCQREIAETTTERTF